MVSIDTTLEDPVASLDNVAALARSRFTNLVLPRSLLISAFGVEVAFAAWTEKHLEHALAWQQLGTTPWLIEEAAKHAATEPDLRAYVHARSRALKPDYAGSALSYQEAFGQAFAGRSARRQENVRGQGLLAATYEPPQSDVFGWYTARLVAGHLLTPESVRAFIASTEESQNRAVLWHVALEYDSARYSFRVPSYVTPVLKGAIRSEGQLLLQVFAGPGVMTTDLNLKNRLMQSLDAWELSETWSEYGCEVRGRPRDARPDGDEDGAHVIRLRAGFRDADDELQQFTSEPVVLHRYDEFARLPGEVWGRVAKELSTINLGAMGTLPGADVRDAIQAVADDMAPALIERWAGARVDTARRASTLWHCAIQPGDQRLQAPRPELVGAGSQ